MRAAVDRKEQTVKEAAQAKEQTLESAEECAAAHAAVIGVVSGRTASGRDVCGAEARTVRDGAG